MVYTCAFITVTLFLMAMGRPQEPVDNALPPQSSPGASPVPIINQAASIDPTGNFNYSYETGNGIKVEEAGILKHVTGLRARGNFAADDNTPDEDDILVQTGSFSYTAPDGTVISLRYTADENGFQPIGDHLPTPPPIPASILRVMSRNKYFRKHNLRTCLEK
ncbi:Cuticular protein 49Ae [Carabus blaptoides fortunei]